MVFALMIVLFLSSSLSALLVLFAVVRSGQVDHRQSELSVDDLAVDDEEQLLALREWTPHAKRNQLELNWGKR